MNIAVYEDDRIFADKLEKIIRIFTHSPTISNTANEKEFWEQTAKATGPILYFLDIVLAGTASGFEAAQRIAENDANSLIVFLTNYPEKIIHNSFFKTKAFSVIYKSNPVLEEEIKETISLAVKVVQGKCFLIHVDKFQTLHVPYDSICYIEAVKDSKTLCIHCLEGQYLIRGRLKSLYEILAPLGFVFCHKSILINKTNIRTMDKAKKSLIFSNGAYCPYSFRMKGNLGDIR